MTTTNYVVTVQKSTAVTAVATGYFTSSTEKNLIVAKTTHLEIYLIEPEGLKLVKDVDIYGRINTLKIFRFDNMNKDWIFLLTDKCHSMILDCQKNEQNQYEIITKRHRSLKDNVRLSSHAPLCTIDTTYQLILLRLSDGIIKVIDLKDLMSSESQTKTLTSFDMKIEESLIIDLQVLSGHSRPTFAVLFPPKPDLYTIDIELVHEYHIRTYQIDMNQCKASSLSWSPIVSISEAKFLIPFESKEKETFSCLILGRNQIVFCKENQSVSPIHAPILENVMSITGYCRMNDQYLITAYDKLFQLNFDVNREDDKFQVNLLGHICLGNQIAYLEHNLTFIGSIYGDSQLLRILPELKNDHHLELVETFSHAGPIVDMTMLDLERQGRQLVTCSGMDKDASLRFIRTGIGIHEYASMDLRNIKGIWALKINHNFDNHLVVSFFDQTRLFQLQNDEVEEVELPAFDFQHQTLFCANVHSNQYLQITTYSIRLIGNHGQDMLTEWKKDNEEITVATCNPTQCLCAIGNELFYFEIGQGSLNIINHCKLPHNIACLDISPLNPEGERTDLCVVGLWTQISVWTCRLPSLEALHKEPLTTDTLPRSVVMIAFDGQAYVVISLADGPVVYYSLDSTQGLLFDRRKSPLGRKPTTLTTCQHTDLSSPTHYRRVLFACSDRPSVLSSFNGKLIFSSVNLREIVCMCSIHSEFYGPSLTLVTDIGVILGRIDDLQKLHVRSLPLGESVGRIATVGEQKSFIILTSNFQSTEDETETANLMSQQAHEKISCPSQINRIAQGKSIGIQSNIVLLDQHTHEARLSIKLYPGEEASSVCEVKFSNDETTSYIAVGTVMTPDDDSQAKIGRIILFRQETDQKLTMTLEKELNNPPYELVAFQGQLLAAVGNRIRLYQLSEDKSKLIEEFEPYQGQIECLQLKVKDDFIITIDLMASLTVLRRDHAQKKKFEQIAHNPSPVWSLSCEFIDDETFVVSTDQGNLVSYRKNSESTKEQERNILIENGSWHIGEQINVFKHGCLIAPESLESNISFQTCLLMGGASGYIGLLVQIPPSIFELLQSLQKVLVEYLPSVGQIEHSQWRSFDTETASHLSSGFIDGDLIEHYLDLQKNIQSELIKNLRDANGTVLETTVEDLVKIIEDLSRLH